MARKAPRLCGHMNPFRELKTNEAAGPHICGRCNNPLKFDAKRGANPLALVVSRVTIHGVVAARASVMDNKSSASVRGAIHMIRAMLPQEESKEEKVA